MIKNRLEKYMYEHSDEARELLKKIVALAPKETHDEINKVYYPGISGGRPYIAKVLELLMDKRSKLIGAEHLKQLQELSNQGKSCLILSEHYSNTDLCNICYFTDKYINTDFADNLVTMAGIKLNTDSHISASFSSPYNRIIIYPSRGIEEISDEEERAKKMKEAMAFNMASMKELITRKHNKQITLVFPSGTRIRPWDDNTKRGVKEIASYVKTFEYICFVSLNGNMLPIDQANPTIDYDIPTTDLVYVSAHPIIESKKFLAECNASLPEGVDSKTHVVNEIMKRLFAHHDEHEVERLKELAEKPASVD